MSRKSILIIGEYSGLSYQIAECFRSEGYKVRVISNGDGQKNLKGDIYVGTRFKGFLGLIIRVVKLLKALVIFGRNNRMVIYINAFALVGPYYKYWPNRFVLFVFRTFNRKLVLVSAGDDWYVWNVGLAKMPYSWKTGVISDYKGELPYYASENAKKWNEYIADKVDYIWSFSYLYTESYSKYAHKLVSLMMPFNFHNLENPINSSHREGKLNIVHGITRYFTKGSDLVERVVVENNHQIKLLRNLDFSEYLTHLSNADVIIDQCWTTFYGINTIINLSLGKIVIGGSEPVALAFYGITACPVINVEPNTESLNDAINYVNSLSKEEIRDLKEKGKLYVRQYHSQESFIKALRHRCSL